MMAPMPILVLSEKRYSMKSRFALLAVLCALPIGALASPFSIITGVGTTGILGGLQYRESPYFSTEAQVGGFSIDPGFSSGGEHYNMGVRLLAGQITEQWQPWRNGFYLAAGVLLNGNRFSLQPSSANTGDYAFATPASVTFNPVDPYIGLGYTHPIAGRWSFRFAAGVAYQGRPKVSVTLGTGPYAQAAASAEYASLKQSLNGFQWFPVIQAGIMYHFA